MLYAYDFDIYIIFVQLGYEGLAYDGTVLKRAINKGFNLLLSYYYLSNSSYSKKHYMLLVPY